MNSEMVNAVKELAEAIKISGKKKTKGYDTTAEVKRIEGRTAWVHIPGGVDETPVLMTINAKAGDSVQVRVSGGRAWIIGNGTAPPTDDTKANQAFAYAMQAEKKAGRVVKMAEDGEFDGKDGADGNEVVAIYPQWCFSTSNSQFVKAAGYDWQDTIPTYVSGLYYWTRTVTEYSDGTVTYSDPVFDASAQASAEAVEAADTAGEAAETAQGIAEDALAVAGEKKRVFNAQPSPPYDLGDIWFDGGHGLTKKCIYARDDDESYDASDWEVINDTSYYFWYDSSGAHVSTVQGSVATGNSQTITPYGTVIMQNGKLVSSWTGSTYSDAALNFYDCTSGTLTYDSTHKITETVNGQPYEFSQPYSGQDGNLMASFNRCGVLLFANNKKMVSLTPSGLVFYQSDSNSTKMAEYLSAGINLYASGQKKVGITTSGLTIYQTVNDALYPIAEYGSSGVKLYSGTNLGTEIKAAGADFYASGTKRMALDATNGLTIYDSSGSDAVAVFSSNCTIGSATSSNYNVHIHPSNGVYFRQGTSGLGRIYAYSSSNNTYLRLSDGSGKGYATIAQYGFDLVASDESTYSTVIAGSPHSIVLSADTRSSNSVTSSVTFQLSQSDSTNSNRPSGRFSGCDILIDNDKAIRGRTTGLSSNYYANLVNISSSNNAVFGYTMWDTGVGNSHVYGYDSKLIARHSAELLLYNSDGTSPGMVHILHDSNDQTMFRPSATNAIQLGSSSYRWSIVYSNTSSINSDLKNKHVIDDFDWKIDEFIAGLKPIAYRRIYEDGSGEASRINLGFGAQDVAKLVSDLGIGNLAMYRASIKGTDENGQQMDVPYYGEEIDDSHLTWSLSYNDLMAPIVMELQRLMTRVAELERSLINVSGS